MSGELSMWTIYDHPTDYPDCYVARQFLVGRETSITDNVLVSTDIDQLRQTLMNAGLTCLTRNESDDPKIVETWL
jgi:hypothetical protein